MIKYNGTYSLDKLRQYVGDNEKQIREMVLLFINTIPPDLLKLNKYAAASDFENTYKMAHRIKPSFDVFDLKDIYSDIKEIEALAKDSSDSLLLNSKVSSFQLKVEDVIEKMKHDFLLP